MSSENRAKRGAPRRFPSAEFLFGAELEPGPLFPLEANAGGDVRTGPTML